MNPENIVEFQNVVIDYQMKKYAIRAVNNVSLSLVKGKITALVGESGSGKTTLATSLLNCISEPGRITGGSVLFRDKSDNIIDVAKLDAKQLNHFRWKNVSMVFQGAQSTLNPVLTVFEQFHETLQIHNKSITKEEAISISRHYLEFVNLNADRVMESYPHELSGGMKQRVMIAFALLLEPDVIILDEPTTALDVITQKFIFELLKEINVKLGITMFLLTHDIAIVAKYADYVGVMYGGRLMEYGDVFSVFSCNYHPYVRGLINATPSLYKDIRTMRPIEGTPPNLLDMPTGCVYHPRCSQCTERCIVEEPESHLLPCGEVVKCHLFGGADE